METKPKKKKKKYFQREIKPLFVVKWKYLSGQKGHGHPDTGETRLEAVTADEAKSSWLVTHNIAGRKFKVLSVTEESDNENNQQTETNERHSTRPEESRTEPPRNKGKVRQGSGNTEEDGRIQTKSVGTSKDHGDWDGVPDF